MQIPKHSVIIDGIQYVPLIAKELTYGIHCPKCGCIVSEVVNSRYVEKYHTTWRRRECRNCSQIWNTMEIYCPRKEKKGDKAK